MDQWIVGEDDESRCMQGVSRGCGGQVWNVRLGVLLLLVCCIVRFLIHMV